MPFSWGAAARGGSDALEQLLAERYAKTQEAEQVARELARDAENTRRWQQTFNADRSDAAALAMRQAAQDAIAADERKRIGTERALALSQRNNALGMAQRAAAGQNAGTLTPRQAALEAAGQGIELPDVLTKAPQTELIHVPGPGGKGKYARAVTPEDLATPGGIQEYVEPREPRQGPAPHFQWVERNGEMVWTSQPERGDMPASQRERGQHVVSGDANRISEFDSSLDDADVLTLAIGDTGTMAKVQASLPNWATEVLGGWGSDAKSRQAVISRVKQVIGKTLEGGVLRREDEIKYKDILPTIGDNKDVALSKVNGLKAAIAQRRTRLLDALDDAGYDVTKFHQRSEGGGDENVPPANTEDVVYGTAPRNAPARPASSWQTGRPGRGGPAATQRGGGFRIISVE